MDLLQTLQEFGLTKNEASVYFALLQLGPSPVLAIARHAGLKRPTTYLILDVLIEKGLVVIAPRERKKLFLALPPERLLENLERRIHLIHTALPELSALYRTQTQKPSIQLFDSVRGMMNIYREIVSSDTKELLSFFSVEAVPKELFESFGLFIDAIKNRKVSAREIAYAKHKRHFYIEKLKKLPNYEIRFTSSEHKFLTDNFIYGNKVAIFSFKKRFAVTIESEDVAASFRSLFELAWQSAEKI